jgi:hypothetical protein
MTSRPGLVVISPGLRALFISLLGLKALDRVLIPVKLVVAKVFLVSVSVQVDLVEFFVALVVSKLFICVARRLIPQVGLRCLPRLFRRLGCPLLVPVVVRYHLGVLVADVFSDVLALV